MSLPRKTEPLEPIIVQPVPVSMRCGHCKRLFGILHGGSGPMVCCECVAAQRKWLALGGNGYAVNDEHIKTPWCDKALAPIMRFAEEYASRSGVTIEWLKENGREAQSCNSNEDDCEGFQMAHMADFNDLVEVGADYVTPYPSLIKETNK